MAFVLSYCYLCSFFPCHRIFVPVLCDACSASLGAEHCSTFVKSVFSSFCCGPSQQPLVVKSASAVTVFPAPALALQGVWSQFFVPLCCSCLFSSLGVFSAAFCHLGLLSHTILLLFLAWGSSFGVCSGLGLRCCGPGYGSSLWGGGGSLSLVLVVLAWLLQLFLVVQIAWISWTCLLMCLSLDFQCFTGSSEEIKT